jgi:molybdenum cofactor synthesis domain-containing protein
LIYYIISTILLRGDILKRVRVEDAVGMVVAHDLTKIVPGEFKGAAFKKGHVISEGDIEELKSMGKSHIYILEMDENSIHEDEAAHIISKSAAGNNVYFEGPNEGKITIKSSVAGLLKVNIDVLDRINSIDNVVFVTMHNNSIVDKGTYIAGTRIIPLVIDKSSINKVEEICREYGNAVSVKEFESKRVGVVVTGTEVFEGRIKDKFGTVLAQKINEYGCVSAGIKYAPDDKEKIKNAIKEHIENGCEVVIAAGGMSVDADDLTPGAINEISDEVVTYGAPVLPGAMFMLAYKGDTAVIGMPACGMYHRTTIFDLVFPRILAGEKPSKKEIVSLGHGGLCLGCEVCRYTVCPFGK